MAGRHQSTDVDVKAGDRNGCCHEVSVWVAKDVAYSGCCLRILTKEAELVAHLFMKFSSVVRGEDILEKQHSVRTEREKLASKMRRIPGCFFFKSWTWSSSGVCFCFIVPSAVRPLLEALDTSLFCNSEHFRSFHSLQLCDKS